MFIVATTSSGDTAVREMTPASAPDTKYFHDGCFLVALGWTDDLSDEPRASSSASEKRRRDRGKAKLQTRWRRVPSSDVSADVSCFDRNADLELATSKTPSESTESAPG